MSASLGGVRVGKLMAHVDFGVTLVIVVAGSMPRSASSTTGRASSYERPLGLCQRLNRLTYSGPIGSGASQQVSTVCFVPPRAEAQGPSNKCWCRRGTVLTTQCGREE